MNSGRNLQKKAQISLKELQALNELLENLLFLKFKRRHFRINLWGEISVEKP